jgi:hypothetical protein
MLFSKTIIIAIDSHGFYPVKDNKIINIINVSDINTKTNTNSYIKNIYKINATFPGVKNISTKKIRNKTMKKIQTFIQKSSVEQLYLNEEILDNYVLQIREILIECNNEIKHILEKDISYIKRKNIDIESEIISNYLHHYDKIFSIEKNIFLDKNYIRFQPNEKYKDKLLVMNINEQEDIDLFVLMKEILDVTVDTFNLSDIIQMLSSMSVENIIILDFSCSDFKNIDTMEDINSRTTRYIRREINKIK